MTKFYRWLTGVLVIEVDTPGSNHVGGHYAVIWSRSSFVPRYGKSYQTPSLKPFTWMCILWNVALKSAIILYWLYNVGDILGLDCMT